MNAVAVWSFRVLFAAVFLANTGLAVAAWDRGLYQGALCAGVCVLAALLVVLRIERTVREDNP